MSEVQEVAKGPIREVMVWVDGDPGKAALVYEEELTKKIPRKKLLEQLDQIVQSLVLDDLDRMPQEAGQEPSLPLGDDGSSVQESIESEAGGDPGDPGYFTVRIGGPKGKIQFECQTCGYRMPSVKVAETHLERHRGGDQD